PTGGPGVDLFPLRLPDVVDEEAHTARIGIEGKTKGIPQAIGKDLAALGARGGPAGGAAARGPRALERVARRDEAGRGDPQDLAEQHAEIPRRVVVPLAAVPVEVAVPVADGDIEKTVLAEPKAAAVVVALRDHVVEQDDLAGRIDRVVVRQNEARHPIDASQVRLLCRVIKIDTVIRGKRRIDRGAEQTAFAVGAILTDPEGRLG